MQFGDSLRHGIGATAGFASLALGVAAIPLAPAQAVVIDGSPANANPVEFAGASWLISATQVTPSNGKSATALSLVADNFSSPGQAAFLNYGDTVSTAIFLSNTSFVVDLPSGSGYLAVDASTSGGDQFGWIELDSAHNVVAWAYQTEFWTDIYAGQTAAPEPASLSVLALGALGVASIRRRRAGSRC